MKKEYCQYFKSVKLNWIKIRNGDEFKIYNLQLFQSTLNLFFYRSSQIFFDENFKNSESLQDSTFLSYGIAMRHEAP